MQNQRFKNVFNGDKVTITDTFKVELIGFVKYRKDVPVEVGTKKMSDFTKPLSAFQKAYIQI